MKHLLFYRTRKHAARERGQVLVFLVLGIVGLIAMTGLAIDGGAMMLERRDIQSDADAAALAGALAIVQGENPYTAIDNVLAQNDFDTSDPNNSVQISISHDITAIDDAANFLQHDAAYFDAYDDYFVQVILQTTTETSISKVIGINSTEVNADATAHAHRGGKTPLYYGDALVALSPHNRGAFTLQGGIRVATHGSGIFVNSDHSKAFIVRGGTIIQTESGIGVVGGADLTPSVIIDGYTILWNAKNPPFLSLGVPQLPVPPDYSYIPTPPAPPSCSGLPTITKSSWNNWPDGTHITLTPGNYVNGITILGGVTHVEMQSGVYCIHDHFNTNGGMVIDMGDVKIVPQDDFTTQINGGTIIYADNLEFYDNGGGLTINGGNQLHADRFRFYSNSDGDFKMLGGAIFKSDDTFFYLKGGIASWNGGSIIDMTAPPQDDPDGYGGLLMYKPWENTKSMKFYGGSSMHFAGTLLLPHTDLQFNGGNMLDVVRAQIIAYTLKFNGGSNINVQFDDDDIYGIEADPVVELLR